MPALVEVTRAGVYAGDPRAWIEVADATVTTGVAQCRVEVAVVELATPLNARVQILGALLEVPLPPPFPVRSINGKVVTARYVGPRP